MLRSFSSLFAAYLDDRAEWRAYLATKFPDDAFRNESSAEALRDLAAHVRATPDALAVRRLAWFRHSNLGDQYLPGDRAQYALERYGFHAWTPADEFLCAVAVLAAEDEEDVPDWMPAVDPDGDM